MKINIKTIFIFGILLCLSIFLARFVFTSDEKRITKTIDAGEKAIEAKDLDGCMERLSYSYSDDYGLNYLQAKRFLERFFQEFQDIEIQKEDLKITIKEKEASVSMNLRVIVAIRGERGYLIGSDEKPAAIKIDLEKERTKWLVKKTVWPKRYY